MIALAFNRADQTEQKYFLAIVDSAGVVQTDLGQVELKLGDIRDILTAAGTITLDDAGKPAGVIKFREVQFCKEDGSTVYAIIPVGGFYTKGA